MNIFTDLLKASAMDLWRTASEVRLVLIDQPGPANVEALRSLRVELVTSPERFQQIVDLAYFTSFSDPPSTD